VILVCGDGALDPREGCDDDNSLARDGCSGVCAVEPGYECPVVGEPCVPLVVCDDGVVGGVELCDDGNTESGDGCVRPRAAASSPATAARSPAGPARETVDALRQRGGRVDSGEECDDGAAVARRRLLGGLPDRSRLPLPPRGRRLRRSPTAATASSPYHPQRDLRRRERTRTATAARRRAA
jgi:cysteine-rich repeat protein